MNHSIIEKTSDYFKRAGIRLPTISELCEPNQITEEIKTRLNSVDKNAIDPLNLFRVHWFNNRDHTGFLNVPEQIITAPPTDGLWEDSRTDEQQIGATYEELEWAMDYISAEKSTELTSRQQEILQIYNKFHATNAHKMRAIPVFDASAFKGSK